MPGSPGPIVSAKGGISGVQRSLSGDSAFGRKVRAAAGKKVLPRLQRIADDGATRANARIAELYQPRSGYRHKKGTVHLHGSVKGSVTGAGGQTGAAGFPFIVKLTTRADPRKVSALNYGARPHTITAGEGKLLRFPRRGLGASYASLRRSQGGRVAAKPGQRLPQHSRFIQSPAAGAQASNRGAVTTKEEVNHPGNQASYFMETSLERAVQIHLRKAVHLPRP